MTGLSPSPVASWSDRSYNVDIPSTATRSDASSTKQYTVYSIVVSYTRSSQPPVNVQWQLEKRYSEFQALRSVLQQLPLDELTFAPDSLPAIPQANWFNAMDAAVVEQRRVGLRRFLQALLQLEGAVDEIEPVQHFLQLPPELLGGSSSDEEAAGDTFDATTAAGGATAAAAAAQASSGRRAAKSRLTRAAALRLQNEWKRQAEHGLSIRGCRCVSQDFDLDHRPRSDSPTCWCS